MNTKNTSTVDVLLIAAMLTAEALVAIVRLLVVPTIALVVVLLTPRRPHAMRPEGSRLPQICGLLGTAQQPAPIAAPEVVSLATIADSLMALPAVELRRLTGTRRKASKHALVAQLLAMPI